MVCGGTAFADTLDWTGFGPYDPFDPVTRTDDTTIEFTEDLDYGAVYYFNDYYLVPDDAALLSFHWAIDLKGNDTDDYLTFDAYDENWDEIFFYEFPVVDQVGQVTSGDFAIDLSPYQGWQISLAWGFIEGGWPNDFTNDSSATISNIDLAIAGSAAPVPEPATMLLFGSGLFGFVGLRRRKFFNNL